MKTSHVSYLGNLSTKCTHLLSGSTIITDAPLDNEGNGANFSPTDLLATSLATCMLTVMGISAKNHGFTFEDAEADVLKTMGTNPRRVIKIQIQVRIPDKGYSESQRKILRNAAMTCPVAMSVHPDIKQDVSFSFD